MIIPTAEPFFFPGGRIGCLLIHGFTGSPKEMRTMGEDLHRRGYTVLGVRLAGHATQPDDMLHIRWQDWLLSVEDSLCLLEGAAERIFVCGLSMGGALALMTAARFPVAGVVAMSTPYELPPNPLLRFLPALQHIKPRVSKTGSGDWVDPQAAEGHVDYPYYPSRAILTLNKLLAEMRSDLPKVTAPVFLIHSRDDRAVPFRHMEKIYLALGSEHKEMLLIEQSGHVIVRDQQRGQVFEAVDKFVQTVGNSD